MKCSKCKTKEAGYRDGGYGEFDLCLKCMQKSFKKQGGGKHKDSKK